ncbi:hypothetical protein SM007_28605 [Streptomyces avermitilis]|nr:hypothetical protein SM007_28605 [Streptomyces avermitilis]
MLLLSDDERAESERCTRRATPARALALRARIVPACAGPDVPPFVAVAPELRVAADTVRKWRRRFLARRPDALAGEPRPGRPPTISVDQDTQLVVAAGRPLPGNRHGARAYRESGAARAVKNAPLLGDGGYRGTPALIPHWPRKDRPLTPQQQAGNAVHRRARACVEHAFSRRKTYKILRDCRLRGDGVHQAILAVARPHHLALAGQPHLGQGHSLHFPNTGLRDVIQPEQGRAGPGGGGAGTQVRCRRHPKGHRRDSSRGPQPGPEAGTGRAAGGALGRVSGGEAVPQPCCCLPGRAEVEVLGPGR